jgi:hypothetical protein
MIAIWMNYNLVGDSYYNTLKSILPSPPKEVGPALEASYINIKKADLRLQSRRYTVSENMA